MADEAAAPRSRRALLTAAAATAGALAASAALPISIAAHDAQDVQLSVDNPTTVVTTITNSAAAGTAFAGAATGDVNVTDVGFGVQGTSLKGAGVFGWSVSAPANFDLTNTNLTGVFGSSPAGDGITTTGTGVWGDSDDTGVLGSGDTGVAGSGASVGVYGYGAYGVVGESTSATAGVLAVARSATDLALEVQGKVKFSRSGRATIGKGKSSIAVTLAGTSSGSRVFAVLHTNRTGRWVQSVVPTTGKFTIYLNGTVSSSTYVAWFVLN
jgi:hypothetical protein